MKSRFMSCLFLLTLIATVASRSNAHALSVVETESGLTVLDDGRIVLVYNKVSPPVPSGIDPVYQRSGFLHPVNTPAGVTLTDTFPIDHAHQHGIFAAWVRTSYADRQIDFWNLAGRTGRVLHERVVAKRQDETQVGFEVDMLYRGEVEPKIDVLRERWKITVYPANGYSCFDIESTQTAITNTPLVVERYHYGGMALRGPSRWLSPKDKDSRKEAESTADREPSAFLNDLGQDRLSGNHSPSKWVVLTGTLDGKPASIAVLAHPLSFRAPQPARLHGTKPYFCFSPCVSDRFEITPSQPFHATYRYLVTDAAPDPAWLNEQWDRFAQQVVADIK